MPQTAAQGFARLRNEYLVFVRDSAAVNGAVIDHDFNTVDVFVYVDMRKVTEKYFKHYTRGIKSEGGEA